MKGENFMKEKVFAVFMTVVMVFMIFFGIPASGRNVQAASKAGAYKVTSRFCIYTGALDGQTENGTFAYLSSPGCWVTAHNLYEGQVYQADRDGYAKYYFWWGNYCYFNVQDAVEAGHMIKIA